jgi:hypothetical protein
MLEGAHAARILGNIRGLADDSGSTSDEASSVGLAAHAAAPCVPPRMVYSVPAAVVVDMMVMAGLPCI